MRNVARLVGNVVGQLGTGAALPVGAGNPVTEADLGIFPCGPAPESRLPLPGRERRALGGHPGVSKLRGAEVEPPDVRAGFSAVLAASVPDRPPVPHGAHHIERNYHQPFDQFASLGLRVARATA